VAVADAEATKSSTSRRGASGPASDGELGIAIPSSVQLRLGPHCLAGSACFFDLGGAGRSATVCEAEPRGQCGPRPSLGRGGAVYPLPRAPKQADLNAAPAAHLPHFAIFPFGAAHFVRIMEVRIEKGATVRVSPWPDERVLCPMPDTRNLWYVACPTAAYAAGKRRHQSARSSPAADCRPAPRAPFRPARLAAHRGRRRVRPTPARLDQRRRRRRAGHHRLAPRPWQAGLAGVRPLLEELLGALDSTFVSRKLMVAAFAGLLLGAVASLRYLPWFGFSLWPPGLGWVLPVVALFVWSWLAVVLSR